MQTAWLIDGMPQHGLTPADRGLAYGDGLFETIAAPRGRVRRFDRHFARLSASCERLGFACPSREAIEADIAALLPASLDCVVKVIVTRGGGGRGYRPPRNADPTRVIGVFPWPEYPQAHYHAGIRAVNCSIRLGENPAIAGLKHLCRLEQVLAQREIAAIDAAEGLMCSVRGDVISGTMSNVFVAVDGQLCTPRVDRCGVAGVMRSEIIDAARADGMKVHERIIDPKELPRAAEMFFCNSVLGIWPVRVLDDIAFDVGKLTQSLMERLAVVPR